MTNQKETVLGRAKVSPSFQLQVIKEARPHLDVKEGDYVEFVLVDGNVVVRKEGVKK